MKALFINWRSYVLLALSLIGFVGLFSEPSDDAPFLTTFLISKAIGFAAFYAVYRLADYWERKRSLDLSVFTNFDDTWE